MGKIPSRWKEVVLSAVGLALLIWMVEKIGLSALKENLMNFGPGPALLLIALYGLAQVSFAMAWFVLLEGREGERPAFRDIFLAYAAGDAVNMTVPSGNIAGEPVKVMLVKDKMSLEAAVTSVTVYKFSDVSSMTLFLFLGWALHFGRTDFPALWSAGSGIVVLGTAAFCLLLYVLQKRGLYHPAGKWLEKLGVGQWIVRKLDSAHLIDHGIRTFYESHHSKFFTSLLFNFLAWFGGVLEIFLFLKISGHPADFRGALVIETFTMLINNLIFFIPARIGVGEGSRVLLFASLGYPYTAGLSYGIVRRIRELAWIGFGFLLLIFRKKLSAEPTP